jgi:hypothetical protein
MKSPLLGTAVACPASDRFRVSRPLRGLAALALSLVAVRALAASDKVFDARGFSPNRPSASQLPFEHIDPMTGNVLLTFTDLSLPGNAGFDLNIQRTYNSKMLEGWGIQEEFEEDSWAGLGWSLHMGRVLNPGSSTPGPTIELPDGGRRQLFQLQGDPSGTTYVTREHMRYVINPSPAPPELRLPSGIVYEFGHLTFGTATGSARYATRIRDPYGNEIRIAYACSSPCQPNGGTPRGDAISTITQRLRTGTNSFQERLVEFEASSGEGKNLTKMKYGTRQWIYTSESVMDYAPHPTHVGYTLLTRVTPPEGADWQYGYVTSAPQLPRFEIKSVTTPGGGRVEYDFVSKQYYFGNPWSTGRVLATRRTYPNGGSGADGTWTYAYNQTATFNHTIINGPCSSVTYKFLGIGSDVPTAVWRIGLLDWMETRDGGTLLQREEMTWAPSVPISPQGQTVNGQTDNAIWTPLLTHKKVSRGRSYETEYQYHTENFNDFGRAWKVIETGDPAPETNIPQTRTTERVFQYGFTPYIVDRIASETVTAFQESRTRSSTYDGATGFRKTESAYGVPMTYEKTPFGGNVESVKDGRGFTTRYTYDWGRVRKTTTAEGFAIDREINPSGTIAWERRGGLTTSFLYDDLFRLRNTDPPAGNDTSVTYLADGDFTTTRGMSSVATTLDGFGRPVSTINAVGIKTRTGYDACGRRNYQSYPHTTVDIGTGFSFDALGRIREKRNPGHNPPSASNHVTFDYQTVTGSNTNGIDVRVVDEEGRETVQDNSAFGNPDEVQLVALTDALVNTARYSYDVLGNLIKVDPSGNFGTRTWNYNSKNQLESETHPESGTISYQYYDNGTLRQRDDAAFAATIYSYDRNNRLTFINRAGTNDVSIGYDHWDNRLRLDSTRVKSSFVYVDNRLSSRTDVIDGRTFTTSYTPDANDNIEWIQYPSGTRVRYFYDAQNRITMITNGATTACAGGATFNGCLADSFAYHPSGAVQSYRAGNGQTHATTFDAQRYWITDIDAGAALSLDYRDYDKVGNVGRIDDTRPGFTTEFDITDLDYDPLDRLEAVSGWGQASFLYDDLGNRTRKTTAAGTVVYGYQDSTQWLDSSSGPEPAQFDHDPNGNLTEDGTRVFTYTPANMLSTAVVGGATHKYYYDGDNVRKQKVSGSTVNFFVHGPGGQILSEFEKVGTGPLDARKDYVYAGSRLVASVRPPTLAVAPGALTFAIVVGAGAPPSKSINVSASGTSLPWTAVASKPWVQLQQSPAGGSGLPGTVSVTVVPGSLPIGTHTATVTIAAAGALGSPKTVEVRFVITATPTLVVQPTSLQFAMAEGGIPPAGDALDVLFSGASPVTWSAEASELWLALSATGGTTPSQLVVGPGATAADLPTGTHQAFVTVRASGQTDRVVPVTLVVQPPSGGTCAPGGWYCEPFDGLEEGDLAGQDGWEQPPTDATSPQVTADPRGIGHVMGLDPAPGKQDNTLRDVEPQPLSKGVAITMQVMAREVPVENRQIAKIEFFTQAGTAWGKTGRTFGALRFGNTIYLQYGPNVYKVLEPQMEPGRWYQVRVEYASGQIWAYVDNSLRFHGENPLQEGHMEAFALTGWDLPGSAYIDLIDGRGPTPGLVVNPLRLEFKLSSARPAPRAGVASPVAVATAEKQGDQVKPRAGAAVQRSLSFERNQGQTDSRVAFLTRGTKHSLYLTPEEQVISLRKGSEGAVVRVKLAGANVTPDVVGEEELPSRSRYYVGSDPSRWQNDVPHFARVKYRQVYPGIDLVFHGRDRELEYDLIVAPTGDPDAICLRFEGADGVRIDGNGDLVLDTQVGSIVHRKPVAFQGAGDARKLVAASYLRRSDGTIGFEVGEYDRTQPLVIDPVLVYGTFLGGSDWDAAFDIAVDEDRQIHVAGITSSLDFPTTAGYQGSLGGSTDLFVTKFSTDGSHLIYSTYLGGSIGTTLFPHIALSASGDAYVTLFNNSPSFPILNPIDSTQSDNHLVRFAADGTLVSSSNVGGVQYIWDVAVNRAADPNGVSVYLTGTSTSSTVLGKTVVGVNQDLPCCSGPYVAKIDPNLGPVGTVAFVRSLNGQSNASESRLALDGSGAAYVTGSTFLQPHTDRLRNPWPVSLGGYQSPNTGSGSLLNAFVTKLVNGQVAFSALVGGTGNDQATDVGINPSCELDCLVHVAGVSDSPDFHQPSYALTLNPTGATLVQDFTVGDTVFYLAALAVDDLDRIYVTGGWSGESVSMAGRLGSEPYQFGGPGAWLSLALDGERSVYVAGAFVVGDPSALITPNAFDAIPDGQDALILKLVDVPGPTIRFGASTFTASEREGTARVSIRRSGDAGASATVDFVTANGSAQNPADYIASSGTLTFAPGDVALGLAIPLVDDSLTEALEDFTVHLQNAQGATLTMPPTASVAIIDDDTTVRRVSISDRVLSVGPNWTATVNVPWLTLSQASGTGPSTIWVTLAGSGSEPAPGLYEGVVHVTGDTGNSPQDIRVILKVE